MSKLKEQTLFSATSIDNKDLFWISKYVSGTEGSAGVYQTFRLTAGQVRSLLTKQYTSDFTPGTVGNDNTITHNLNTRSVIVQMYDIYNEYAQIIAEVKAKSVNTVQIKFNENPLGDVKIVIVGV
jgi:hypothetical protein